MLYRLISPEEADSIVSELKTLPWTQGRARTQEITGTVKNNLEVERCEISSRLSRKLGETVLFLPQIQKDWIPNKLSGIRFSCYKDGASYDRHTDSPMMGEVRTDLACTVFLTDDYEGGELCIDGKEYKGKKGECVVYSCGLPHWVNPVTKGERICGFTWIQSYIPDPKKREIVKAVHKLCFELESNRKLFVDCGQIHGDLMRMWMQ